MCIICNLTDPDTAAADAFLHQFRAAGDAMKASEESLLRTCEQVPPDVARRYRSLQKQMARLRRAWNQLEHEREKDSAAG